MLFMDPPTNPKIDFQLLYCYRYKMDSGRVSRVSLVFRGYTHPAFMQAGWRAIILMIVSIAESAGRLWCVCWRLVPYLNQRVSSSIPTRGRTFHHTIHMCIHPMYFEGLLVIGLKWIPDVFHMFHLYSGGTHTQLSCRPAGEGPFL